MTASRGAGQLFRTLAIITAAGVISTGVTFAALQSPQISLTNNAINIGAADLQISTNGTVFTEPSTAGFNFSGVVPGGGKVPAAGNTFYLKNNGTAPLALKASISTTPNNLANINLTKVYFSFTRVDVPEPEVSIPLQTLISANTTGGVALGDTLNSGATAQYSLRVSMDIDAYSGTGVGVFINGVNLSFTGVGS